MLNPPIPQNVVSVLRGVAKDIGGSGADTILNINLGKHAFEVSLILSQLGTCSRILDVGGGFGVNLIAIRKLTHMTHELSLIDRFTEYTPDNRMGDAPLARDVLRAAKIDVTEADVWSDRRLPFPDGHHDVVTLFDVVEHLPGNPVYLLKEIRRVLRPDGVILLSGPNLLGIVERAKFLLRATHPYMDFNLWTSDHYFSHYREFTRDEYVKLLTLAGFTQVQSMLHVEPIRTMARHGSIRKKIVCLVALGTVTAVPSLRPGVYCIGRA